MWALVLAIASFAIFPVVPAIIALFLASSAERTIRASRQVPGGALSGEGMVRAARIVAWINLGIALGVVVLVVVIVLVLLAIGGR